MKPGQIVLVRFPFTSLDTTKKRPALVLSNVELTAKVQLVTVAMVTSQIDSLKLKGDCLVQDWEGAGLLHPSLVRMAKIATLDHELVEKVLGKLSARDQAVVASRFQTLFKSWLA